MRENFYVDFVKELIKGLASPDRSVQIMAVSGLSQCHDQRAIEALKKEAFNDTPIRKFATVALNNLLGNVVSPDLDFVAELIKGLVSPDPSVQIMAAYGLSQCHEQRAIGALKKEVFGNSPNCKYVAAALGNLVGRELLPEIIQAFQDPFLGSNTCLALRMLIEYLGVGKEIIPVLKKCLRDPSFQPKYLIIDTLVDLGCDEALDSIIELISDANKEVRATVARSLQHYTGKRVFDLLLVLLEDPYYEDPYYHVRKWAAYSLAKVGQEKAIPHLQKLATAQSPCLAQEIIKGLGSSSSSCCGRRAYDQGNEHDTSYSPRYSQASLADGVVVSVGDLCSVLGKRRALLFTRLLSGRHERGQRGPPS